MSAVDQEQLIAQLKAEVAELKSTCLKLSNQPKAFCSSSSRIAKLEREAQQARRQYDQVLADRRKQAAALEQLMLQFQELHGPRSKLQEETPEHRQFRQLQNEIQHTAGQLREATAVQQQYQEVLQQLKEGHGQFDVELEQTKAQVQKQHEDIQQLYPQKLSDRSTAYQKQHQLPSYLMQRKAQLLQVQHARDTAKKDLQAAEQQLAGNRAHRTSLLHQLAQQCQTQVQQQLQSAQPDPGQVGSKRPQQQERCNPQQALADVADDEACKCGASGVTGPCTCRCMQLRSCTECVRELLIATGCKSPRELLLHVQALLQARAGLQQAADATGVKPLPDG